MKITIDHRVVKKFFWFELRKEGKPIEQYFLADPKKAWQIVNKAVGRFIKVFTTVPTTDPVLLYRQILLLPEEEFLVFINSYEGQAQRAIQKLRDVVTGSGSFLKEARKYLTYQEQKLLIEPIQLLIKALIVSFCVSITRASKQKEEAYCFLAVSLPRCHRNFDLEIANQQIALQASLKTAETDLDNDTKSVEETAEGPVESAEETSTSAVPAARPC